MIGPRITRDAARGDVNTMYRKVASTVIPAQGPPRSYFSNDVLSGSPQDAQQRFMFDILPLIEKDYGISIPLHKKFYTAVERGLDSVKHTLPDHSTIETKVLE